MKIVLSMSNLFWTPVYEKGIIQDMVVVAKRTHLVALNAIRISGSLDMYHLSTRSLESLQTLNSGWRPFGSLDFAANIAYSSTLIEFFFSYTSSSTLYTAQ